MLTGRAPFEGDDRGEVLLQVERGTFPPPRQVKPTVDRALDAICRKAMALEPGNRYPSAKALAEDVEHWLSDQPVAAYPDPITRRAARWMRRNKQLAGSMGALLLLAMCGVGYHDWKISRAETKARGFLKVTLLSVGEMLEVCGVDLALVPNTEKIRDKIAHMGLSVCEKVADNFPDDTGVQFQTAQVYRVIAGIERITDQFDGSKRAYERAIGILSQHCESNPSGVEIRSWLVEALIDRGSLFYMHGDTPGAERDFKLAIVHADKLKAVGQLEGHRRGSGTALINLADIYVSRAEGKNALDAATRAVDFLGPLAEPAVPNERTPTDRWLLSLALANRAAAHRLDGTKSAAESDMMQAETVANHILAENPDYTDARFQLAILWNQRAKWLVDDSAALPAAIEACDKAIKTLEELIKGSQFISFYREQLAATLTTRARARCLVDPGRSREAAADCKAALALAQGLVNAAPPRSGGNPHHLSLIGRVYEVKGLVHRQRKEDADSRNSLIAARDNLKKALDIDPSRATDKELLAEIERRLAGGDGNPDRK